MAILDAHLAEDAFPTRRCPVEAARKVVSRGRQKRHDRWAVWETRDTDRSCRSDRAKSERHMQSGRFIHWKPIPADWYPRQRTRLVSHFQGRLAAFWLDLAISGPDRGFHPGIVSNRAPSRIHSSSPDAGPAPRRSGPGRGPTVASGPQQHLSTGLLRGPISHSSPGSSRNTVDTVPSAFLGSSADAPPTTGSSNSN